jgi:triacylglycerol lipase
MNVQSAINAGLFVQFVANTWQDATGKNANLDGRPILNTAGQPIIPGKNYTVLKTLYACDLATDIHPNRPCDDGWKTMGILATNNIDPTDVFIAIRGTVTIWEWIHDVKFFPKPFTNVPGGGLTEDGFTDMYQSFSLQPSANPGVFINDLIALIPAQATVTVTGHSLGAAIATLFALDLAAHSKFPLTVYTLASPRVGDLTFHNVFDSTILNAFRIANRLDIVPKTPPPPLYIHVGDETELVSSGQVSPTIPCEHHLTTYLNLLATEIETQASYPIQPDCVPGAKVIPLTNPSASTPEQV